MHAVSALSSDLLQQAAVTAVSLAKHDNCLVLFIDANALNTCPAESINLSSSATITDTRTNLFNESAADDASLCPLTTSLKGTN